MRRYPTSAPQRPLGQRDNAPVAELDRFRFRAAFGDLAKATCGIAVRIAGERAMLEAENQHLAQRHAAAQLLALQAVHFDVTHVAEDEARRLIEHAQTLRHVVER